MSYAAIAPLLVASLDLQLVRLIRGAIAANGPNAQPGGAGGRASGQGIGQPEPRLEGPRLKLRPEPLVLPREVHRPEPIVDDRFAVPAAATPIVPPAMGPLPAPWQTLLREKVWNRPIEAPPAASPPDVAAAYAPRAEPGGVLNAFL